MWARGREKWTRQLLENNLQWLKVRQNRSHASTSRYVSVLARFADCIGAKEGVRMGQKVTFLLEHTGWGIGLRRGYRLYNGIQNAINA